MSHRLRSALAALALVLMGATLAACGDKDDSSGDPGVDKASSTTPGSTLSRSSFFSTLSAAQRKAGTAHVTMTIGVAGQSIKANGDVQVGKTIADNRVSMTMETGQTGLPALKMILVGSDFYLNFGKITEDKYAKIDLKDKDNPLTKQFGSLLDQMDPSAQFTELNAALKSFGKKGSPVRLDGVEAQPYQVVVDTSKLSVFASLPSSAAKSIPPTLTYVMYVGPDHLLRRITYDVAGSKSEVDYTRWGAPVDIKAPPAGDVTDRDISKLFGGLAQSV